MAVDVPIVCCMRIQNHRTTKNGGWLHKLTDVMEPPKPPPKQPEKPPQDFAALLSRWGDHTPFSLVESHAETLGVSPHALTEIGACYSSDNSAWAFPMYDALRNVVGIRLRNERGDKWAVRGSKSGVFLPAALTSPILVVEGPTDCAACLSIGLCSIGRPDCNFISDIFSLTPFLGFGTILPRNTVLVLVGDVDCKLRPDGTTWNPGGEGVERLSKAMTVPHYCMTTPGKDMREAVRNGFNRQIFDCLFSGLVRRMPKPITPATGRNELCFSDLK
jgi:hypothetical protein